jgi:hypothetical protein
MIAHYRDGLPLVMGEATRRHVITADNPRNTHAISIVAWQCVQAGVHEEITYARVIVDPEGVGGAMIATELEAVILQTAMPRSPRTVRVEMLDSGVRRVTVSVADERFGTVVLHVFDLSPTDPALAVVLALIARPPATPPA